MLKLQNKDLVYNIHFYENRWLNFVFACFCMCFLAGCPTTTYTPRSVLGAPLQTPAKPAVILMIGDGMGLAQISAAIYSSNRPLALEKFPVVGFHKPYAYDNLVTDSAAGATAFACGIKTYTSAIGVDMDTLPCPSIIEMAQTHGLATGIIATSTLVHATPASFMAHNRMRVYYEEIALDISEANVDFLVGGGKRYFDRRDDEKDLVTKMRHAGYFIGDYLSGDLRTFKPRVDRKFLYFAADNQPLPVIMGRTYLPYAAKLGAEFLDQKSDKGFLMIVEGSQIDWANHANEGNLMIEETLDFDKAVGEVLNFAKQRGNTLVIVTADHESGGLALNEGTKQRRVKTAFTTNGHTAALVPVLAYGPNATDFSGIYENTALFTKIKDFLNLN